MLLPARLHSLFIKSIKLTVLLILSIIILGSCSPSQTGEWTSLFNGKDLTGWKIKISGYTLGDNHKNTFRVVDGNLLISYDEYETFNGEFGHIFYEKKYSHYIIRTEYRFIGDQVPNGPGWAFRNNGIMLHCQSPESMGIDQDFPVSIEAQMLGGNGMDDRTTGNVCTPGTNIVMNGELITRHCSSSNSATFHGDQWVTMEVEVRGSEIIRHIINGDTVLAYTEPQLDERDKYAKKMLDNGADLLLSKGYISLQAESHPTEFRKIEIKILKQGR